MTMEQTQIHPGMLGDGTKGHAVHPVPGKEFRGGSNQSLNDLFTTEW